MARYRFTNPKLNITPMVDVVFLLLIFFMVATTFIRRAPDATVEPPVSRRLGDRSKSAKAVLINVRKDGKFSVAGEDTSPAELAEIIRDSAGPVIVRADGRAAHKHTVDILETCAGAGRRKVKLVVLRDSD